MKDDDRRNPITIYLQATTFIIIWLGRICMHLLLHSGA